MKNIFRSFALSAFLLFPSQVLAYGGDAPHEAVYIEVKARGIIFGGVYLSDEEIKMINHHKGTRKAELLARLIIKNVTKHSEASYNASYWACDLRKAIVDYWCAECEGQKSEFHYGLGSGLYINMITKGQTLSVERQKDYDEFKAWRAEKIKNMNAP